MYSDSAQLISFEINLNSNIYNKLFILFIPFPRSLTTSNLKFFKPKLNKILNVFQLITHQTH